MDKYLSLINPNKLKRDFIIDFIKSLSSKPSEVATNFKLIESRDFSRYTSMLLQVTKGTDKHLPTGWEIELSRLKVKFKGLGSLQKHIVLGVSEVELALVYKVEHMILCNRWNHGNRYTLDSDQLRKIQGFIKPLLSHI